MTKSSHQCEQQLPSGKRCRAHARTNDRFCFFHSPEVVADRVRARRAGGVPLHNIVEICDLLADSINQVRRGQVAPRVATAVGYLSNILLGALQQGLPIRGTPAAPRGDTRTGEGLC